MVKNYLNEEELNKLNNLTNIFLVSAEDEAKERHIINVKDWINSTDYLLKFRIKEVLQNSGNISHKQAVEKAEIEYKKYIFKWTSFIINIYTSNFLFRLIYKMKGKKRWYI